MPGPYTTAFSKIRVVPRVAARYVGGPAKRMIWPLPTDSRVKYAEFATRSAASGQSNPLIRRRISNPRGAIVQPGAGFLSSFLSPFLSSPFLLSSFLSPSLAASSALDVSAFFASDLVSGRSVGSSFLGGAGLKTPIRTGVCTDGGATSTGSFEKTTGTYSPQPAVSQLRSSTRAARTAPAGMKIDRHASRRLSSSSLGLSSASPIIHGYTSSVGGVNDQAFSGSGVVLS